MEENIERSELIRKKYLYRRLIMSGKIMIPVKAARQLIGPDCAYHLYSTYNPKSKKDNINMNHGDPPEAGKH